ncbi:unnamed protein product [Amoebophrya sp. A120]|nr:unnamed protein product [Amoebophrya sp. A120]|eukprot:GSA120T00002544001.1
MSVDEADRPGRRKRQQPPTWLMNSDSDNLFGDGATAFGGDRVLAEERRRASLSSKDSMSAEQPSQDELQVKELMAGLSLHAGGGKMRAVPPSNREERSLSAGSSLFEDSNLQQAADGSGTAAADCPEKEVEEAGKATSGPNADEDEQSPHSTKFTTMFGTHYPDDSDSATRASTKERAGVLFSGGSASSSATSSAASSSCSEELPEADVAPPLASYPRLEDEIGFDSPQVDPSSPVEDGGASKKGDESSLLFQSAEHAAADASRFVTEAGRGVLAAASSPIDSAACAAKLVDQSTEEDNCVLGAGTKPTTNIFGGGSTPLSFSPVDNNHFGAAATLFGKPVAKSSSSASSLFGGGFDLVDKNKSLVSQTSESIFGNQEALFSSYAEKKKSIFGSTTTATAGGTVFGTGFHEQPALFGSAASSSATAKSVFGFAAKECASSGEAAPVDQVAPSSALSGPRKMAASSPASPEEDQDALFASRVSSKDSVVELTIGEPPREVPEVRQPSALRPSLGSTLSTRFGRHSQDASAMRAYSPRRDQEEQPGGEGIFTSKSAEHQSGTNQGDHAQGNAETSAFSQMSTSHLVDAESRREEDGHALLHSAASPLDGMSAMSPSPIDHAWSPSPYAGMGGQVRLVPSHLDDAYDADLVTPEVQNNKSSDSEISSGGLVVSAEDAEAEVRKSEGPADRKAELVVPERQEARSSSEKRTPPAGEPEELSAFEAASELEAAQIQNTDMSSLLVDSGAAAPAITASTGEARGGAQDHGKIRAAAEVGEDDAMEVTAAEDVEGASSQPEDKDAEPVPVGVEAAVVVPTTSLLVDEIPRKASTSVNGDPPLEPTSPPRKARAEGKSHQALKCTPEKPAAGGLFPVVSAAEPPVEVTGLFRRSSSKGRLSDANRLSLASACPVGADSKPAPTSAKAKTASVSAAAPPPEGSPIQEINTPGYTAFVEETGSKKARPEERAEAEPKKQTSNRTSLGTEDVPVGGGRQNHTLPPETVAEKDFSKIPLKTRLESKDLKERVSAWQAILANPAAKMPGHLDRVATEQLRGAYEPALNGAIAYAKSLPAKDCADSDIRAAFLRMTGALLEHKQLGQPKLEDQLKQLWIAVTEVVECGDVLGQLAGLLQGWSEKTTVTKTHTTAKVAAIKKQLNTGLGLFAEVVTEFGMQKCGETNLRLLARVAGRFVADRVLRTNCYAALVEVERLVGERVLAEWTCGLLSEPQRKELPSQRNQRNKGKPLNAPVRKYRRETTSASRSGTSSGAPQQGAAAPKDKTPDQSAGTTRFLASGATAAPSVDGCSATSPQLLSNAATTASTSVNGVTVGSGSASSSRAPAVPLPEEEFDLMAQLPRRYQHAGIDAMHTGKEKKEYFEVVSQLLSKPRRIKSTPELALLLSNICKVLKAEQNHLVLTEAAFIVGGLAGGLGRNFDRHGRQVLRSCLGRMNDKTTWKLLEEPAWQVWQAGVVSLSRLLEDLGGKFTDTSPNARSMSFLFLLRILEDRTTCVGPEEEERIREIAIKTVSEDAEISVREQAIRVLLHFCKGDDAAAARLCDELPVSRRRVFETIREKVFKPVVEGRSSSCNQDAAPAAGATGTGGMNDSVIQEGGGGAAGGVKKLLKPTTGAVAALPPQGGRLSINNFPATTATASVGAPVRGMSKSASERRLPRSRLSSACSTRMPSPRGPQVHLTQADRAAGLQDEHFPVECKLYDSASRVNVPGLTAVAQHWQQSGAAPPPEAVEHFVQTLHDKTMHFSDARPLAARAFLQFFQSVAMLSRLTTKVVRLIVPRLIEMAGDAKLVDQVNTLVLDLAEKAGCGFLVDLVCHSGRSSGASSSSSHRRLKHLEPRLNLLYDLVHAFGLQNAGGVVPGVVDLLADGFDSRVISERKSAFRAAELMCRFQTSKQNVFQSLRPAVTQEDAYRRLQELYGGGGRNAERPPPVQTRGPVTVAPRSPTSASVPAVSIVGESTKRGSEAEGTVPPSRVPQFVARTGGASSEKLARGLSSDVDPRGAFVEQGLEAATQKEIKLEARAVELPACNRALIIAPPPAAEATISDSFLQEERKRYSGGHIVEGDSEEHDFRAREKEYQRQIKDLQSQLTQQRLNGSLLSEAPSSIQPPQSAAPHQQTVGESVLELKERLEASTAGARAGSTETPTASAAARASFGGGVTFSSGGGVNKSGTPPSMLSNTSMASRSFSGGARRKLQVPPRAQAPNASTSQRRTVSPAASLRGQSPSVRGGGSIRASSPRGTTSLGSSRGAPEIMRSSRTSLVGGGSGKDATSQLRDIVISFDIFEPPHHTVSRLGGKEQRQNSFSFLWGPEDIPADGWRQLEEHMKVGVCEPIASRMFDFGNGAEILIALEAWSQHVNKYAPEIIEILDLLFRYITYVLHKVTNTRVYNAALDLLTRVIRLLDEQKYVPTEKEALMLLPILCEKLGHNQRSVRDALCTVLRGFVQLYPRSELPKSVLLTLVRGCASKNKKSVCDLLEQLESLLVISPAPMQEAAASRSTAFVPPSSSTKVDSRLCFLLAKSQRDVVILTNLVVENSGNAEVKKLGLGILHTLMLGLDYETFYHCIRKNVKPGSLALQQVDQWIARHDLARNHSTYGPPPRGPVAQHASASVNTSVEQAAAPGLMDQANKENVGARERHNSSMLSENNANNNASRLSERADQRRHYNQHPVGVPERPPRPAQLASPKARHSPASSGGRPSFIQKVRGPSLGSPSLRGLKTTYPPQYERPSKIYSTIAEMISQQDTSCLDAIQNNGIKMQEASREDVTGMLKAVLSCQSFTIVRALMRSYLDRKPCTVSPGLLQGVAEHLLSSFDFTEEVQILTTQILEFLMPIAPQVAIKLHERVGEKKRGACESSVLERELEELDIHSQNRDVEQFFKCSQRLHEQLLELGATTKQGTATRSELLVPSSSATSAPLQKRGASSVGSTDQAVLARRLVALLQKNFPSPQPPSPCAGHLIALTKGFVEQLTLPVGGASSAAGQIRAPQEVLRSLLHCLLVTLTKSTAWKRETQLLEQVNLCTVQLLQTVFHFSPVLAYQMLLSFTIKEQDIGDHLAIKCIKKMNKLLLLQFGAAMQDSQLQAWIYSVLLDFANNCVDLEEQRLAVAISAGSVVFDGLQAAAARVPGLPDRLETFIQKAIDAAEERTRIIFCGLTRRK